MRNSVSSVVYLALIVSATADAAPDGLESQGAITPTLACARVMGSKGADIGVNLPPCGRLHR